MSIDYNCSLKQIVDKIRCTSFTIVEQILLRRKLKKVSNLGGLIMYNS